jgi:hypothetical protein
MTECVVWCQVSRAEYESVRDAVARAERELLQRDKQIKYLNDKLESVGPLHLRSCALRVLC